MVMIQSLRFEPFGQCQRFEPREQQSSEEQHTHIHLHLHLHLSFRLRPGRFWSLGVNRLTTIFAALTIATTMAFVLMVLSGWDPPLSSSSAAHLILTGFALAWGAAVLGGLPLLVSTWRRSPRARLPLVVPSLALLLLVIIAQINPLSSAILAVLSLTPLGSKLGLILLVFVAYPLFSTIMFNRAFRQAQPSPTALRFGSLLSFVVVGGLVLLLLGGLLYYLSQVPYGALWSSLLPPLLGMCVAVLVALCALFWQPRWHRRTQAWPKDASPSDVDASGGVGGYRS